jgi:nitrilase
LATASSTSAGTSFAAPEPVEPQVLDVLALLLRERERVVPKEELLDAVRGSRFIGESALTSRVKTARRAIGDDGRTQQLIRTVHGRGYQFVGRSRSQCPGRGRALSSTTASEPPDLIGFAAAIKTLTYLWSAAYRRGWWRAEMAILTVAAVQAAYVLMDRKATLAKVEELMADPAVRAADLVVFPEAFVPGTPIWIDGARIWDGDEQWFVMLADQAVVVPSEATDRLGAAAREAGVYLVIGINERESTGSTIYNTLLYFDADGNLLGKHRKLMPTGSERTVWGMGDGSTLDTYSTPFGRIGGLICWENYMPLARFYLYSQGVDVWVAPTLARGDAWVATLRHIAREGRCYVIGVNPCVHVDQIPADFPDRDRVWRTDPDNPEWVEPGNTVIVGTNGEILAGPARHAETVLVAELDLTKVLSARRLFDPVGHYHRPDVFRLAVDTAPRPVVTTLRNRLADE